MRWKGKGGWEVGPGRRWGEGGRLGWGGGVVSVVNVPRLP